MSNLVKSRWTTAPGFDGIDRRGWTAELAVIEKLLIATACRKLVTSDSTSVIVYKDVTPSIFVEETLLHDS
jgi:hypothetical protein